MYFHDDQHRMLFQMNMTAFRYKESSGWVAELYVATSSPALWTSYVTKSRVGLELNSEEMILMDRVLPMLTGAETSIWSVVNEISESGCRIVAQALSIICLGVPEDALAA